MHGLEIGEDGGASHRERRSVVPLLAFLGVMAYALPMGVVTPALPLIQRGMHTTPGGAAWALTGMTLSASVLTPLIGRLGDLYGPRRVLLVVLTVTIAGLTLAASAPTLAWMVAGRVLSGAGSGVFPLAFTIIRDALPARRTASAIGLMSAMLGLGGAVSWVLAGPVIDHLGWRWLLWMPLVALVPGYALAWWIVPRSAPSAKVPIDWWGAVLFAAWLVAALTALTQAPSWGWTSGRVFALAGAAAVLAAIWLRVESRVTEPLVDLRLMRLRGVWTANAASLLSGYALMASGVLFPQLVQLPASTGFGFGGTATQAALLQLPASIGMTMAGLAAGILDSRIGSRAVLLGGAVLVGSGYVLATIAHGTMGQLYAANILRGVGLGLAYAAVANLVVAAVPYERTGVATGVNTLIRTVGASLGTQVSAVIVAASVSSPSGLPAESGFTAGFAVCAAVMGAVVVIALISPGRGRLRGGPPGDEACGVLGGEVGGEVGGGRGNEPAAPGRTRDHVGGHVEAPFT